MLYGLDFEEVAERLKDEKEKFSKGIKDGEKQDNNVLSVVGGTTGIILVIVFFLTRNVTVYNYKDGEYKKVGKVRATKAGKIKLDRFSLFETTNKYKLELSKNLTKKLKGKMITVSKNGTTIKMLVNGNEKEKYIVEVRI